MSPQFQESRPIIDMGAPSWCWAQLGLEGEGILSYQASRGRTSLAVPYAVTDGRITIPLAGFNEAGWRASGTDTCLEVSGRTRDDRRWVVRATGTADRVEPDASAALAHARRVHPANRSGSAGSPWERLYLREPRVRGYYETPLPV
jgi:hypothetical protein